MASKIKAFKEPTHEEIAVYAYYLWEFEGRPHGKDKEHWQQARAYLIADRQYEAGVLKSELAEPKPVPAPKPKITGSIVGTAAPIVSVPRARKPLVRPARPVIARELVPA